MTSLQDYIKLAEAATEGPWDYIDEFIQTSDARYVIALCPDVDMTRGNIAWIDNAPFIAASRTLGPAMAQALIKAEELLQEFYDYGYDRRKCERFLSKIATQITGENHE